MKIENYSEGTFDSFDITISLEQTVDDVKHEISIFKHIEKEALCIVYNGDVLTDDVVLSTKGITLSSKLRYFVSHCNLQVESIYPVQGYTSGGTRVTIQGNFPGSQEKYTVRFGVTDVVGQYVDEKTVVAFSPAHPPGPVTVTIKIGDNGRYAHSDILFSYFNTIVQSDNIEVKCVDKISDKMYADKFASGGVC
ncbi:hypothetical protein EIN_064290 [Entamoeba invadens IP1]|uniref:Ubiquitin-like domain-containing protein n=1 Tax=Entamoeba invadens IP1 TaxID=370355 RepID=A0A0A1TV56_ENTIV|nr:hypothetical protein EIN_064290 [Entamoeba invadens IP1]ELP84214.1 hypothetical protein EIN_064290 [Entamoeba invadens IP1]|eukprot:XP_004183560.1 hypothetical protein EIN_064290 [Entamoeba invadens IP1]